MTDLPVNQRHARHDDALAALRGNLRPAPVKELWPAIDGKSVVAFARSIRPACR
jgi:hypothetical protein